MVRRAHEHDGGRGVLLAGADADAGAGGVACGVAVRVVPLFEGLVAVWVMFASVVAPAR